MDLTLSQYVQQVKDWSLDPRLVIASYQQKAKSKNDHNNAYISFTDEYVDSCQSDFLDRDLCWAPISIKDIILTKWQKATCGSRILQDYVAPYSATCFELLEKAWALMIGKTNMDEFAMWWSGETSAFGPAINPFGTDRVPWGSSSGSAVSVAADTCLASIGTDTWWSCRQPAALCGIVWCKPSYGRISRYGVQSMTNSLDQIWTLTKTVEDAELLLRIMSWRDIKDATTQDKPRPTDVSRDRNSYKIAVANQSLSDWLDPQIKDVFLQLVEKCKELWATVDFVDVPLFDACVPVYYILCPAEVSTNLARFDGIRFGLQWDTYSSDNINDYYDAIRWSWFGTEAKRRILTGTYVLGSSNYDWYYLKAKSIQSSLQQRMSQLYTEYDCFLSPTTPEVAWKFWAKLSDPVKMYLSDMYTVPANLCELPAISVPYGFATDQWESLPVGIHIMTNKRDEATMFDFAKKIEKLN